MDGVKTIQIVTKTQYPIVSAYEFEFLKGEEVVRERMQGCSIYFILQRPLMYFNNVQFEDGMLTFEIVDTIHEPLRGTINLVECEFAEADETILLDVQFYKHDKDETAPFNDVAAFRFMKMDGSFIAWESPQKLLYEALANNLPVCLEGPIEQYLEYNVHYIGKAFPRPIWDRLTGHEKMQKILTLEEPLASKNARARFEIALLMLDIIGFDEANLAPIAGLPLPKEPKPILHSLDTDEEFDKFYEPMAQLKSPELTAEVEAMLINLFKPSYNEILFENYPYIKNGTRSLGYTDAKLVVEKLPVILKTEHHTQRAIG